jgi:hypothetical protein
LIEELNAVLKTPRSTKTREEIDELTHMLKGNLESGAARQARTWIVKNMLHSREGGEHRPADINALVEKAQSPITARAENPASTSLE